MSGCYQGIHTHMQEDTGETTGPSGLCRNVQVYGGSTTVYSWII